MPRYSWLVFTNCDPAHEAEYDHWYDEIHIPDLLRIPGVLKASRSRLTDAQTAMDGDRIVLSNPSQIGAGYRHLAVYTFEVEDPRDVLNEVARRANTPEMMISPYLGEVYTVLYEER